MLHKTVLATLCLSQYARVDEVDKLRSDYEESISVLKAYVDAANERLNTPVQVSFLNIRTFLQDVEVV